MQCCIHAELVMLKHNTNAKKNLNWSCDNRLNEATLENKGVKQIKGMY